MTDLNAAVKCLEHIQAYRGSVSLSNLSHYLLAAHRP